MLKSKIHRATLTGADLDYEGSITIDRTLMEAARSLRPKIVKVDRHNRAKGARGQGLGIRD